MTPVLRTPRSAAGDGYTIVGIETSRRAFPGTTDVYRVRAPVTGGPRVIGVWRR